jgi:hypothetical protein
MKFEFSSQIIEKSSNTKFHEKLSGGSQVVPCRWMDGWMDRHDEDISRFLQFCERA